MTSPNPHNLRVTVLAGGPSAEREVSLQSGAAIAQALRNRGHEVFLADIDQENLAALEHPADVIFPALHGTFGEDGQLQRIMEDRGLCFVGSGSRASAVAMDKELTKQAVTPLGINVAAHVIVGAEDGDVDTTALPLPAVVKPVDQGSSVHTCAIHARDEFDRAIRDVTSAYGRAMVEQFIDGDELTVGILEKSALAPVCVRPQGGFYDYKAKYVDDSTEYVFETGQPDELLRELRTRSEQIFERLGCRHLARLDWIVDRAGKPWFLEVNTLPGFTSHSLVPKAAAAQGLGFDALVERLVLMALEDARGA